MQVSRKSSSYHLTPFTVLVLGAKIQRLQGAGSLWKGVGSTLLFRGIVVLTESFVAEVTALPKDLSPNKLTVENVAQHLTLKAIAIVIVTPFFCSSLLETVQSSIADDSPSLLDCVREGLNRACHWQMSRSTRLLPIWLLFGPTVVYSVCHYSIYSTVKSAYNWVEDKCSTTEKSSLTLALDSEKNTSTNVDSTSSLVGNLVADIVTFPLETILFR